MSMIYCVEDDEGIRELIAYAVKSLGFEIEGFESASLFEERLRKIHPSMLYQYINLHNKEGIEILKNIICKYRKKQIHILIRIKKKGCYAARSCAR